MIEGIEIAVDREAAVVTAREPLTVLSSAFVRGGLTTARAIVNLHVRKNIPEVETDGLLPRFFSKRLLISLPNRVAFMPRPNWFSSHQVL